MPVDSWAQQQHHEYAYDTCCLLSRLMCLMRVLCLVVLLLFSAHICAGTTQQYCCFPHIYVLVLHSTTAFFGAYVLLVHSTTTAVFGT